MTLICAKSDADFINISKVTSQKTKWPRLFWPTWYYCHMINKNVIRDMQCATELHVSSAAYQYVDVDGRWV